MRLWNIGSINADHVFSVPHIPAPGETLASTGYARFLGGKGANMSVAAARAGADVRHIGAVGHDGAWAIDRLATYGVNVENVVTLSVETSQAIIAVAEDGENAIILQPGASTEIPHDRLNAALGVAAPGDWVVTQNESNLQVEALAQAKAQGLKAAYAAAPFSAIAVQAVLEHLDFLILNEVEADQLREATGLAPQDLPVTDVIVTLGSKGATWFGENAEQHFPAIKVIPVDTTGAGDTFTGYVLAGLVAGEPMETAINMAIRASALMVTRKGTADVIPTRDEVTKFTSS